MLLGDLEPRMNCSGFLRPAKVRSKSFQAMVVIRGRRSLFAAASPGLFLGASQGHCSCRSLPVYSSW